MIIIYTVIFSQIMRAKLPETDSIYAYSVYLCAGIITWALFTEIVTRGQNIFISNANILKKINFPRIALPVILTINASLNFAIIFSLFLCFMIITSQFPGMVILAVIPVLIIQILFAIGLGLTLGVLNVFFRDVGQFFNIFLQFWFWLTPIVYPVSILPEIIKPLILIWNPMAAIIAAYQTIFVYGTMPDWNSLIIPSLVALTFCMIAMSLYAKHAHEIVDEL